MASYNIQRAGKGLWPVKDFEDLNPTSGSNSVKTVQHMNEIIASHLTECHGTGVGFTHTTSLPHCRYDGTYVHNLESLNSRWPRSEIQLSDFLASIKYVSGYVLIGLSTQVRLNLSRLAGCFSKQKGQCVCPPLPPPPPRPPLRACMYNNNNHNDFCTVCLVYTLTFWHFLR